MTAARSVKAVFAPTFQTLTAHPHRPRFRQRHRPPAGITGCEEGGHGTCAGQLPGRLHGHPHRRPRRPQSRHLDRLQRPSELPTPANSKSAPPKPGLQAAFTINTHTLTVATSGPGKVSAESGAISACPGFGGVCAGEYDETSTVTLIAAPHAHYHVEWAPATARQNPKEKCEVEIGPSDATVQADFVPYKQHPHRHPNRLRVGSARPAARSAIAPKAAAPAPANTSKPPRLILIATPGPGQAVSWTGCTSATADTGEVEVQVGASDTQVKATFAPITHTLHRQTRPAPAEAHVTCNGAPCASIYPEGTELTLTASPASGSTFAGWSGGGCSGTGSCHLTLEADTAITATFNANSPPPVEEEKKPPPLKCHKGFVKKNGRCFRKPKPRRHHRKRH